MFSQAKTTSIYAKILHELSKAIEVVEGHHLQDGTILLSNHKKARSGQLNVYEFGQIGSNLFEMDWFAPGMHALGLILSTLQDMGLICTPGARSGTKTIFTTIFGKKQVIQIL